MGNECATIREKNGISFIPTWSDLTSGIKNKSNSKLGLYLSTHELKRKNPRHLSA